MPFASNRLGFWGGPPEDRTVAKSNKVLIIYTLDEVMENYTTDFPPQNIAQTIYNREVALGFVPTIVWSYVGWSNFLAMSDSEVATYAHIWDVSYDTILTTSIADKLKTYLQSGGAVFLLGENAGFVQRDNSIDNFIENYMGGGTIVVSTTGVGSVNATVASEFLLSNNDNDVTLLAPGVFSSIGTGTTLVSSASGIHGAVWKTGSLSQAPTGAVCSVLDINFVAEGYGYDANFLSNVSIVLNKA
jgi:hypothetical protein